jgi:hypothetical protein
MGLMTDSARWAAGIIALAVCLAPSGCRAPAKPAPFPSPPDEVTRSGFGKIGVTYLEGPPTETLTNPPGAREAQEHPLLP